MFGYPFRVEYDPQYDQKGRRLVALVSLETKTRQYSILFQRHLTGFKLEPHLDGAKSNKALWVGLWRAKQGGDLVVHGEEKRFLWGRVRLFDGAQTLHEVTEVEQGTRATLLFQVSN